MWTKRAERFSLGGLLRETWARPGCTFPAAATAVPPLSAQPRGDSSLHALGAQARATSSVGAGLGLKTDRRCGSLQVIPAAIVVPLAAS